MNKNLLIIVAVVLLIAGYSIYAFSPNANNQSNTLPPENSLVKPETTSQNQTAKEVVTTEPSSSVVEDNAMNSKLTIEFDGEKFIPNVLTIKQGDTVTFVNKSTEDMWPASADHPTHTKYPEFDAKKPIRPGDVYQFKFEKVGAWGMHDHINPSATGMITVQ